MYEVLVNRLGGLSLPRKSVVRLTDCPDMTLDVYGGRKTTNHRQEILIHNGKTYPWLSWYIQGLFLNEKESLIPNNCHCGETNGTSYVPHILVSI